MENTFIFICIAYNVTIFCSYAETVVVLVEINKKNFFMATDICQNFHLFDKPILNHSF